LGRSGNEFLKKVGDGQSASRYVQISHWRKGAGLKRA